MISRSLRPYRGKRYPWRTIASVVGIAISVGLLATAPYETTVAGIIALSGFLAISSLISLKAAPEDREFLLWLFILGFAVRVLAVFFLDSTGIIREMDSKSYGELGWLITQAWRTGTPVAMYSQELMGVEGEYYHHFNAMVFSLIGYSPLSLKIINSFFGTLTGLCMYLITRHLFNKKAATIGAVLITFYPSFIFWTTQNLKDPSVWFFACAAIWSTLQLQRRARLPHLLVLLTSLAAMSAFRMSWSSVLAAIIAISFLITVKLDVKRMIFSLVLVLALDLWLDLSSLPGMFSPGLLAGTHNTAAWDSAALPLIEPTWRGVLSYLPRGLVYFFLGPFPWSSLHSSLFLMTIPETFLWYSLLPFAVYGLSSGLRAKWREGAVVFLTIAFFTFALSIVVGNIGNMYRHRTLVWILLSIFAGVGLAQFDSRLQRR